MLSSSSLRPSPSLALWLVFAAALATGSPQPAGAHGTYEERLARAGEAVAASPADPEPLIRRHFVRREHGDFAGAQADLDAAARRSPDHPGLDAFRGRLHLESGYPERALAPLERALARRPEDSEPRLALARALVRVGRPLEAAGHYDLAIDDAPVRPPAFYLERAHALSAAGPAHRERALNGIDAGMDRLGPIVALANLAIALEIEAGRFDAALARLDAVAAASQRQETWRARRAEVLERAGRAGDARAEWSRTLAEIDGLSPRHRRTPAMTQLASRARVALERLDPDSGEATSGKATFGKATFGKAE